MRSFLIFLMVLPLSSWGQRNLADISKSIQTGNAQGLAYHFAQTVDINVGGIDDSFTKEKAVIILNSFFEKVNPQGFEVLHKGTSESKSMIYHIGLLKTEKGDYRVLFLSETKNNALVIEQFSLDKED